MVLVVLSLPASRRTIPDGLDKFVDQSVFVKKIAVEHNSKKYQGSIVDVMIDVPIWVGEPPKQPKHGIPSWAIGKDI